MKELRPHCEHFGRFIPSMSSEAMIYNFKCSYCELNAVKPFENVCRSCGGNFQKSTICSKAMIGRYHASDKRILDTKSRGLTNKMKLR